MIKSKFKLIGTLFVIAFSCNQYSYADFGLIQDNDGYVNVRSSPNLKSQIMIKLRNNEIVSCDLDEGLSEFCLISSPMLKNIGYLYKDRINFFKEYHSVKLLKYYSNQVTYSNKDITVNVQSKAARVERKLFEKDTDGYYKYFKNKEFFGTDGDIPDERFSQLNQISIAYKSKVIKLNFNQLEQYFFPTKGLGSPKNELADFNIYYLNDDIYILNTFSNGGAATYALIIHIRDGKITDKKAWKVEI